MTKGILFDIKRFAIHDGPGIRTTAFLKGCPLRCKWCHNPEGVLNDSELMVSHRRCVCCGTCENTCQNDAIHLTENGVTIERTRCNGCDACLRACPSGAITRAGREVETEELAEELSRDRVFFESSGGGVTLSGGEPLKQPEFAFALLRALRARGIDTCVETSMMAPPEIVRQLPSLVDHLLVDIKLFDEEEHRRYTGVSNRQILKNFAFLATHCRDLLVRVPLIPGITDTEKNIAAISRFVEACNPSLRMELLNYNPLAPGKYMALGRQYFDESLHPLTADRLEALRALTPRGKAEQRGD